MLKRSHFAKNIEPKILSLTESVTLHDPKTADTIPFIFSQRTECYEMLNHLCQFSSQVLWLLGRKGVGKTTLINEFVEKNNLHYKFNLLTADTEWDVTTFLGEIAEGFNLPWNAQEENNEVSPSNEFSKTFENESRPWVLLVDNAQNLNIALLSTLFTLSKQNISIDEKLRIVIIGDYSLEANLNDKTVKNFIQGNLQILELEPLTPTETSKYLNYKLTQLGLKSLTLNIKDIQKIYVRSAGIPHIINQMVREHFMDNASDSAPQESKVEVKSNFKDKIKKIPLLYWIIGAGSIISLVMIGIIVTILIRNKQEPRVLQPETKTIEAETTTHEPIKPEKVPQINEKLEEKPTNDVVKLPEKPNHTSPKVDEVKDKKNTIETIGSNKPPLVEGLQNNSTKPVTNGVASKASDETPIVSINKSDIIIKKAPRVVTLPGQDPGVLLPNASNIAPSAVTPTIPVEDIILRDDAVAPVLVKSISKLPLDNLPKSKEQKVISQKLNPSKDENLSVPKDEKKLAPILPNKLINQNLSELENKILKIKPTHYGLQLAASVDKNKIIDIMRNSKIEQASVFYKTNYKGKPWFVLVYGNYTSYANAQKAMANLPNELSNFKPWVHKYEDIQRQIRTRKH